MRGWAGFDHHSHQLSTRGSGPCVLRIVDVQVHVVDVVVAFTLTLEQAGEIVPVVVGFTLMVGRMVVAVAAVVLLLACTLGSPQPQQLVGSLYQI